MNDIKAYVSKIDKLIESKQKSGKANKTGLLAPQGAKQDMKEKKSDLDIVAMFVSSIRNARKEMMDGN